MRVLAYGLMLVFDLAALAGGIWLYEYQGKSGWYLFLAIVLILASSPKLYLEGRNE